MLFLKTFNDAKFVVDGNAFQTFIRGLLYQRKTFVYNASCESRFKQFILMTPSVSVSAQCKEIIEIYIY